MSQPTTIPVLSDAFPTWFAVSEHRQRTEWRSPALLAVPSVLEAVLSLLDAEFAGAWLDRPSHVFAVAAGVTTDTAPSGAAATTFVRPPDPDRGPSNDQDPAIVPAPLALVRLFAVVPALELTVLLGRWGHAYNWLLCALDDRPYLDLSVGLPIEVGDWVTRLRAFLTIPHPTFQDNALHLTLRWAAAAYDLARSFGAPHERLAEAASVVLAATDRAAASDDHEEQRLAVNALSQIAPWASAFGLPALARTAAEELEKMLLSGRLAADAAEFAGVVLSTNVGACLTIAPAERAAALLDAGPPAGTSRSAYTRVSLMVNAGRERDEATSAGAHLRSDFTSAVTMAVAEAHATVRGDRLALAMLQAQRYDQISAAVTRLANEAHVTVAQELVGRWFGAENLRLGPSLYCAPSTTEGVQYAVEGRHWTFSRHDEVAAVARVTAATDHARGTSTTLRQELAAGNPAVDTRSFRSASGAEEMEAAVRECYALDRLCRDLGTAALNISGLFMPHVFRHPVQALLLEALGTTYPLIASFEHPLADRPLRRALVWTAGVTTGELETSVVTASLRAAGVSVDDRTGDSLDRETLLKLYTDPSYDILWLIGHGSFDGAHPDAASIQLDWDGTAAISLTELAAATPPADEGGGRRLLVLNLCESGIAMQAPIPPRVGFGPLLAGAGQAVVGHLWAVWSNPAAYFGAVMARALADGAGFFTAFRTALASLRVSQEEAADRLEDGGGPGSVLAARLRARAEDEFAARGILTWGSPVFYE